MASSKTHKNRVASHDAHVVAFFEREIERFDCFFPGTLSICLKLRREFSWLDT
ncbi:hypothetical protein ACU8MP_29635 (plasmid) [Rhizobium leguminosarum]